MHQPGRSIIFIVIVALAAMHSALASANNIDVSSVGLTGKVPAAHTAQIRFNISWANSWRINGAPSPIANWDAAWIFVKFSRKVAGVWQPWAHCTLNNTGNVLPGGTPAGSAMTFADNSDDAGAYKGVFLYRSAAGIGTNAWTNAQVQWQYDKDGVGDTDPVRIRVFGIEMVYIPTSSFFIGDTNSDNVGNFRPLGGTGPVQIISTLSSSFTASTDSYSDTQLTASGLQAGGNGLADQTGSILNAAFPTGYNKFYLMKYEVSQKGYVDFLNTLTGTQQANRCSATTAGNFCRDDDTTNTPTDRGGIRCYIAPVGATPGVYVNDLNTADTRNSTDDGQWIAANWLSWMDLTAYADWAALRPMTELEFEKAARGPQLPFNDEYVWHNTTTTTVAALNNGGTVSESSNTSNANANHSNNAVQGPVRVGMFATATSSRAQAGASDYGVLDLSGNVWERTVTVGNGIPNVFGGRDFLGISGDGTLDSTGDANVNAWPGDSNGYTAGGTVTGATGAGFRGGTWSNGTTYARVSDRGSAAFVLTFRASTYGGRCARTSP